VVPSGFAQLVAKRKIADDVVGWGNKNGLGQLDLITHFSAKSWVARMAFSHSLRESGLFGTLCNCDAVVPSRWH
jgi:hypothetical protein